MDHFPLLVAVLGLVSTTVVSQSPDDFGNPPPLPAKGTGLYDIYEYYEYTYYINLCIYIFIYLYTWL